MRSWSDYKQTAITEDKIFEAVRQGDVESVAFHIYNQGDINLTNHKGHSLLMLAAYNGHETLTSLLLRHGADVHSRDSSGNTILMGVAFKGHARLARLLIDAGADPWAQNPQGQTALMFAEAFGRTETARLLRASLSVDTPLRPRAWRQVSAFYHILRTRFSKAKGA